MIKLYNIYNDSFDDLINFVNNKKLFKSNFSYFSNKKGKVYNAVHNFSVPSFESGALKILQQVFPSVKNKTFIQGSLKPKSVLESDVSEVDIYARNKQSNISDFRSMNLTLDYIKNKIFDLKLNVDVNESIDGLPKNTSTGFPEYKKKGASNSVILCKQRIKDLIELNDWRTMYEYLRKFPTTIFHRFTPKMVLNNNTYDPNFKIRQIHGTPFFIIVIEKIIMYNFVESFKKSFGDIYTISYNKVDISNKINRIRKEARTKGKVILCGDINGCDKSVTKTHSLLYFNIASYFVNENLFEVFKSLVCYHIKTPMLYTKGIKYSDGSTITGSWITSNFTTVSVVISLYYTFYKLYARFPGSDEIAVQGDDFIIVLDKESDKFLFKEFMLENNLRLRLDKSRVTQWYGEIEFLGYIWNRNNEPDQNDDWIISHILYPEKYIKFDGPRRITYRILSIIINIRRYNYLFNLIRTADKYLNRLYKENKIFEFELISTSNEKLNVKIPLDKFYKYGWRML